MKKHQRTIGKNDEWLTPPEILARLGVFDLDPCAARGQHLARVNMAAPALDGLACAWDSNSMRQATSSPHPRVWLNPPFNRYQRPKWMRKMAEHGNGIMLIPAATETKAFLAYVWEMADAVCFVFGRPHFHFVDGRRASFNCGTAICLVAYGEKNARTLSDADLGVTLHLKEAA